MRSREQADFHLKRTNLRRRSTIGARTVFRDKTVRGLFLQFAERFLSVRLTLLGRKMLGICNPLRDRKVFFDHPIAERVDGVIALLLAVNLP